MMSRGKRCPPAMYSNAKTIKKQEKEITKIVNRFEEKLVDVAIFDIRGDLQIVLGHRGQRVDNGHKKIKRDHRGQLIPPHRRLFWSALKNRPPQENRRHQ